MRYVRFRSPGTGKVLSGVLDGDSVLVKGSSYALDEVGLLAPCVPTKLVCVGRNYTAHAAELGNEVPKRPLLFLKPPSSVIGPEEPILLPADSETHFEAELAVVIGRRCRRVRAGAATGVILGYTCMNDISNRTAQAWETNWVRAKAFDTSAPLGPVIVGPDEIEEPFHVSLRLNGDTRQDGWTNSLIFSIPQLIEAISDFMTLEPGDVIATGTPEGVGRLSTGDVVEVEIEGIGVLRNPVQ
jgi:2-keto-4-pentenoate hydratase/2-oxohepta-3-ene-1,7-dioic acid hydratase in catechol pathway